MNRTQHAVALNLLGSLGSLAFGVDGMFGGSWGTRRHRDTRRPNMEPPQPLTVATVLDLLHEVADALEKASRSQTADALQDLSPALRELERAAGLLLPTSHVSRQR